MRLLVFESKEILRKYKITTPSGVVVSKDDPLDIKYPVMLKAQIPIGGRAKSGGIIAAETLDD